MTFKVKSSLDFLPSDYPCVWANGAINKDEKAVGRWVSDMEYYQFLNDLSLSGRLQNDLKGNTFRKFMQS